MACPHCQRENPTDARFCTGCGRSLEVICSACRTSNTADSRFCKACGKPLPTTSAPQPNLRLATPRSYTPRHLAEKILTSRAALEGERKQVTVLFADLKGSMELLADRDPEEARRLLDPVLERMMEAVHRYEGTVNQVMGDGIMALFGAPIAHEDLSELGYAYALSGRVAEALPLCEETMKQIATMGRIAWRSLLVSWLSETYLLAGRVEDALEGAKRALDLSRDHKERGHEAWTLRLLGEIASQWDPPDVEKAKVHYRQALALADELGMHPLMAHCHLGLGTLYSKMERLEQARLELSAAIELYRSMEMTFWLTRVDPRAVSEEGWR